MTSDEIGNKKIVQRAFDAWDEGRADIFDEVYAKDVSHPQVTMEGVEQGRRLFGAGGRGEKRKEHDPGIGRPACGL